MNLGEAKVKALKLINEYTNNGVQVPAQKNKDYTVRMNDLVNDAQFEISEMEGIKESIDLVNKESEENEKYIVFKIPEDLQEIRYIKKDFTFFTDYKMDDDNIYIPKYYLGNFKLYYYKNPTIIDENTSDDYNFEVSLLAQQAMPYYIGSHVILDENPSISVQLLNEYQVKISRLKKRDYTNDKIINVTGW